MVNMQENENAGTRGIGAKLREYCRAVFIAEVRLLIFLSLIVLGTYIVFAQGASSSVTYTSVRAPNGNFIAGHQAYATNYCLFRGHGIVSATFTTKTQTLPEGYEVMGYKVGCAPHASGGDWRYCNYPLGTGPSGNVVLDTVTCNITLPGTNTPVRAPNGNYVGGSLAHANSYCAYLGNASGAESFTTRTVSLPDGYAVMGYKYGCAPHASGGDWRYCGYPLGTGPSGNVVLDTVTCKTPTLTCTPLPTETRTVACPTGQTGSITETRTSSCATGATTPTWSTWSITSNTCTVATSPTTSDTGSVQQVTSSITSVRAPNGNYIGGSLAHANGYCTFKGFSAGASSHTKRTVSLPSGYEVMGYQVGCAAHPIGGGWRYCNYPLGTGSTGNVVLDSVSCNSTAPTCTPLPSETRTVACPSGQTGSITETRTSSCATGATSPTWSTWSITSNTCTVATTNLCKDGSCTQLENPAILDYSGSCEQALVRIQASSSHIGVTLSNACTALSSRDASTVLAEANRSGTWKFLSAPDYGYTRTKTQGDCDDSYYETRDTFLGKSYSVHIGSACSKITNSPYAPIKHLRDSGIALVANGSLRGIHSIKCDYNVTPQNYLTVLQSIPKKSSVFRNVCFSSGTYASPMLLTGFENLALSGTGQTTTIVSANYPVPSTWDKPQSLLDIRYSRNIVVSDMTLYNTKPYVNTGTVDNNQVSRALTVSYTPGFVGKNLAIRSLGKVPFEIGSSPFSRIYNSSFSGSYFAVSATYGAYLIENSALSMNLAGDEHSLVYDAGAHIFFRNITVSTPTGRSFVSGGLTTGGNQNVRIENITTSTSLDSWVQQHPNYANIHVHLYGTYPASTADFWYNPYGGGGGGTNIGVYKH